MNLEFFKAFINLKYEFYEGRNHGNHTDFVFVEEMKEKEFMVKFIASTIQS